MPQSLTQHPSLIIQGSPQNTALFFDSRELLNVHVSVTLGMHRVSKKLSHFYYYKFFWNIGRFW